MPTLEVNGVDLYHETMGEGPAIVFINGLGAQLLYWMQVASRLSAHRRVIVFDHRGSGRSATASAPVTVEQMSDDLMGMLDALGVERATLVGHSMGGYIAMQVAAEHPSRVHRLVLYSTSAEMNWPALRFIESVERVWSECPDISSGGLTRIFTPWNWSPARLRDNALMETIVQLADANPYKMTLEGFRAQVEACRAFEGSRLLPRIAAPTLVVGGAHDLIAPLELQRNLTRQVEGSRLAVSESGHNTHLEEPDWFTEQVLAFSA